ncbi:anti-sigma factor antagonist [Filobacillus milosensis]|uniref:Anti-sigma factor antagonist n=1 Tax=Filobacillus milosensis TaxID=94137 RepID=A0A4Y8ICR6_9BACI|nr:STAS domain-containing protein [Filobacillus milosensis]TFB13679.1 anti-sigma factor antagonist [Filobacillus milosensis]
MLKYECFEKSSLLEVTLIGDLDIDGTKIINEKLIPQLMKSKKINVNFEQVPFVDSSGVGLLINLVKTIRENDGNITISNISQDIHDVFEILQITEILGKETFIES